MSIADMIIRSMVPDRDKEILDFCTTNKNGRSFSESAKDEIVDGLITELGNPTKCWVNQMREMGEFDPFQMGERLFIIRPPRFVYQLFGKEVYNRLVLTNLESVGIENAFRQFIGLKYPPIKTCTDISGIRISIPSEKYDSWTWTKGRGTTEEEIYKNKIWN